MLRLEKPEGQDRTLLRIGKLRINVERRGFTFNLHRCITMMGHDQSENDTISWLWFTFYWNRGNFLKNYNIV